MKNLMKRVKGPNDISNEPHFAVITYGTRNVYVPGDARSQAYPGHGYPAHTDVFDDIEHWVTTERSSLEEFITELESTITGFCRKPYVILEVSRKGTVARSTKVQF